MKDGVLTFAKAGARVVLPARAHRLYLRAKINYQVQRLNGTKDDWMTLKLLSRIITRPENSSRYGNPRYLGELVNKADPALNLPALKEPKFLGRGGGFGNLNCYRTGLLDGRAVFEKIYFVESDNWRKLIWAHNEVMRACPGAIRTPRLLRCVQGNWLAAAYFDFLPDACPMPHDLLLGVAVDLHRKVKTFQWRGAEPALYDFRREVMYVDGVEKLRKLQEASGRDGRASERVEAWLLRPEMPRCFTHADFSPANVLVSGELIDFDRCGYYPQGYEFGVIFGKGYLFEDVAGFERFLNERLPGLSRAMLISILYFSSIFYVRRININASDAFILSTFDRALDLIAQEEAAATTPCRKSD